MLLVILIRIHFYLRIHVVLFVSSDQLCKYCSPDGSLTILVHCSNTYYLLLSHEEHAFVRVSCSLPRRDIPSSEHHRSITIITLCDYK
jgi:hypothetical protein